MSASAPFNIDLVIQRIRTELGPALQQVRGAADYAAITSFRDFRTPEAFALLVSEGRAGSGGKPGSTGSQLPAGHARQPVAVEFGVVLAVTNMRYQRGSPAAQDAMPLVGRVRDALAGWIPPGVPLARPVQWLRGRVLDYDAGTLLWADTFTTQHAIGRTQQ